jgi:tetratricopeptide (TPR) repeat protein
MALAIAFITILCWPRPGVARNTTPLALYVQARLAQETQSVESYAAALSVDSANAKIAKLAYRKGMDAGAFDLALRAANILDRQNMASGDAQIFLYLTALHRRDWTAARARLADIADIRGLSFLAPLFGEWLSLADRKVTPAGNGSNAYRGESQTLLALAQGKVEPGLDAVRTLWLTNPYRRQSLRIAAAATLANRKSGDLGASILDRLEPSTARASILFSRNNAEGLSVDTPARGAAFLLARVSGDLTVESSARPALVMARLAQYADPHNSRIALHVAGALSALEQHQSALAIATALVDHPIYGDDAASFRIEQLEATGQIDLAMAEASVRASQSPNNRALNDRARLADIDMRQGNYAKAAERYASLITDDRAPVSTVMAAGLAYQKAGNWAEAQPILTRALAADPGNPTLLVALADGLATNGGDVDRAAALIAKAIAAQPDDPAIIALAGWVELRRGNTATAIAMLEQSIRIDTSDATSNERLGDAYWAAGRRIDARYAWSAAKIANGDRVNPILSAKIDRGQP